MSLTKEGDSISSRTVRVNERIRIREVRLIDEEGNQLGVIPTAEALQAARDKGLDLVEVAPNANPPVARLMDYGKFRYEESRKEREARKRQKQAQVKEIRFTPNIDTHDLETKVRHARKFLLNGDKVKVSVRFRGRQNLHRDLGRDLLLRVIDMLEDVSQVDQMPRSEGRDMSMMLSPDIESEQDDNAEQND
jgi:translation initiation factor IF-3